MLKILVEKGMSSSDIKDGQSNIFHVMECIVDMSVSNKFI